MFKKLFFVILLTIVSFSCFADTETDTWFNILTTLSGVWSYFPIIFQILGALTIIGTVIDKLIPDEKDGGFMTKILNVPILGKILSALSRFSPLSYNDKSNSK